MITKFLEHLNSMASDLEITIEHPSPEGVIPFLDVVIHPDSSTSSTGSQLKPISTPTTPRLPPCPLRSLSSAPSPVVRTSCAPPTSRQGTPTSWINIPV